ncbi:hypothetical protein [Nonlabens spongiae]|nr:hypothetical protein [Nonlabens spongiae]
MINGLPFKSKSFLSGFLVLFLMLSACTRMILNSRATHARELKVFEKDDQKVVYIGTTHLAKPSFFKEVRQQVDSLRNEGFVFIKEGVSIKEGTSDKEVDTLRRKLRQLIGLTIGDYSNKENKSLPKLYTSGDYIMQTDSLLGLNSTDKRVDLTYNEMIAAHEEKYGEIILTECDWKTDLFDKYDCRDGNAYNQSFYVVDILRTDLIVDYVLNTEAKKVAVIYGAGHFKWFYPDLIKNGYEYKNEKLNFR